ncbi:MAG: hypoxanthine/guanine phosphoribosyltransferase [Candidatus Methanomethylophilaceae archaeon]|nr:hypoxanthine/guanine phosphoribosyltransferase [Candidatus Methanomethylophilaceae archaeon]MDY0224739.1 hypoxanthine/guanine phosphoribosyltransferase [Candidatus Methanomethylophilaceae archaeon]
MLELLKKSLDECPIVDMNGYHYFVHPVTDGIPYMEPDILNEVLDAIQAKVDFNCDYILGPQAMGIPLAVGLSLRTGIPYNIIRKRKYNLPGEVNIAQYTGYSKSEMFINGIKKGDRVVIVDDVLSTGGTIRAIVHALKNIIGAEVVDVLIVFEKTKNKKEMEEEIGVKIKTLLKVEIIDGKVIYSE